MFFICTVKRQYLSVLDNYERYETVVRLATASVNYSDFKWPSLGTLTMWALSIEKGCPEDHLDFQYCIYTIHIFMNFHLSWFKFSMPGGNITIFWFLGNLACWFTVEQLVNLSLSLPQEQGIPHDLRRRLRSFFLSNKHQAQFAAWIFHNLDECVVGLLVVLFIFWVFLIVILICDVFCFLFLCFSGFVNMFVGSLW